VIDLKNYKTSEKRREKILEHIQERHQGCSDIIHKADKLRRTITDVSKFVIEGDGSCLEPIDIGNHAEGQLLARLKIPASYIHRCPDLIQAKNINYWLSRSKNRELMFRLVDQGIEQPYVRAIFSGQYKQTDDIDLFPIIFKTLEEHCGKLDNVQIKTFDKGEHFTLMKVIFKDNIVKHEGRYYWPGITIANSETGMSAVWIKPIIREGTPGADKYDFLDRCDEGSARFIHRSDLEPVEVKKAIRVAAKAAEVGIAQLLKMKHQMVANPVEAATNFIKGSDFIPVSTLDYVKRELQYDKEESELEIARVILRAVRELPTFKKYLAEYEVGKYLSLFRFTKKRLEEFARDTGVEEDE